MCVGLSAKVVKISEGTAVVDAGGAKRKVSAQLLEDLEPGDYVMVHAGVAIAKITDEDDDETDELVNFSDIDYEDDDMEDDRLGKNNPLSASKTHWGEDSK